MKIQLLNHACGIVSDHNVKLLFDPWLNGTAFAGGWGLRFFNPDAMAEAAEATHLWISHFHSDHFHIATLKALLAVNPKIQVICNDSHNFCSSDVMRKLGFQNTLSLPERETLVLNDKFTVCRIPTTGIDNMLLIRSGDLTVLNYNDCNLTHFARTLIAKRIGHIDVLLSNFNHAEKFLEFPLREPELIREQLRAQYLSTLKAFRPRYAIPFASYHYYRCAGTSAQNSSMMTLGEVCALHPSVLPLPLGETVEISSQRRPCFSGPVNAVVQEKLETQIEEKYVPLAKLESAWKGFKRQLARDSLGLARLIPSFSIRISDCDRIVTLGQGWKEDSGATPTLECTSGALLRWWSNNYGTDTFWIGGHFNLLSANLLSLRLTILFGLLTENRINFRHLFAMIFSRSGRKFLWNRREEIVGLLASRHFMMGTARAKGTLPAGLKLELESVS